MEENKRYVRLGIFVFVAVVVAAAILFILGGRSLFQTTFTFETYFNQSVAGLEIGAPVRFRGVPMGQVTAILTSAATYEADVPLDRRRGYIVVRAKVTGTEAQVKQWKQEEQEMVRKGLRVQTQLAGITGQQYLALDLLDPKKYPPLPFDWTPEYPYVPSAPSRIPEIIAGVQTFLASLNEANVRELGQNLNKLVVDLDKKVEELPVGELSAAVASMLRDAHATVNRVNAILTKPEIDATLRNVDSASARLDRLLADPGLKASVDNTSAFTERLRKLTESGEIDRMVKSIDDLAQRLDAVAADNQYDVRVIVEDLRATAGNLRTLSETLKRYPAGALVGGPPEKLQLPGKSP
jgi:phospholipid/cholesterol/gamma-HCH transport system substrate-binding protein